MENASKALIIAGAILLSIAIIGIGMSVFNQAQDSVNNANMDEAFITTFNSKFTPYEGKNIKGSRVNNLLSTIAQNNLANQDDESIIVKVKITGHNNNTYDMTTETGTSSTNMYGSSSNTRKLPSGYSYDVTFTAATSGLYTQVLIEKK